MVDISVVIVTYNNEEQIGACLDSILQEDTPVYEILVIDNASCDGTLDNLDQYKDAIKIVKCEENYGFARGNNIGFEKAQGKYVFLLNPDTVVEDGCLDKMHNFMEQHKDVTLLAPLVHNPDGTIQQSLRIFPTYRILFFELSGLSRVFPSSKILNEWRMPDFDYNTIADVDQPMGAALFIRKGFFSDTFIDEQFNMFFNDVDLCKRIKRGGGQILFYPDASIVHERGKSTARVKERMIPLHTKGLIRYFAKHNRSFFDTLLFTFFVPVILLHTMLRVFLFRFFSKDF